MKQEVLEKDMVVVVVVVVVRKRAESHPSQLFAAVSQRMEALRMMSTTGGQTRTEDGFGTARSHHHARLTTKPFPPTTTICV